jgi:hypothetical protein
MVCFEKRTSVYIAFRDYAHHNADVLGSAMLFRESAKLLCK